MGFIWLTITVFYIIAFLYVILSEKEKNKIFKVKKFIEFSDLSEIIKMKIKNKFLNPTIYIEIAVLILTTIFSFVNVFHLISNNLIEQFQNILQEKKPDIFIKNWFWNIKFFEFISSLIINTLFKSTLIFIYYIIWKKINEWLFDRKKHIEYKKNRQKFNSFFYHKDIVVYIVKKIIIILFYVLILFLFSLFILIFSSGLEWLLILFLMLLIFIPTIIGIIIIFYSKFNRHKHTKHEYFNFLQENKSFLEEEYQFIFVYKYVESINDFLIFKNENKNQWKKFKLQYKKRKIDKKDFWKLKWSLKIFNEFNKNVNRIIAKKEIINEWKYILPSELQLCPEHGNTIIFHSKYNLYYCSYGEYFSLIYLENMGKCKYFILKE
ncbi:hypothetical protein ACR34G_01560 [Mycoplasma sp. 480]|uniref:hypothetical protein n=1 Tax=Mycoplasma sp. 480 TaxID=3440155 RepID=UPI003F50F023